MIQENILEDKTYPFEFSVIMAVHNVAPFLCEAIDSLIVQDFGLEKIQIILVDDGSTDGSEKICDEYLISYPNNITVVHQQNSGVGSARNNGMKYAKGRYLNFMDSDDKLSRDTMSLVFDFFTIHGDETDIVSIPLVFFDSQSGGHPLNWKFKDGNRVIDLYREPSKIQLSMASIFVKHEAINEMFFDPRLTFAEDAKLLLKFFLKSPFLGVLSDAIYYYRKRSVGELSAIQKSESIPEWYLPYIEFFQEEILNHCLNLYGYIPKFVQYTLAYDLQWRIRQQHIPENLISAVDKDTYINKIFWIAQYLDDDVILAQKSLWQEHKLFLLMKKHKKQPAKVISHDDIYLRFENTNCYYFSNCQFTLEFINLKSRECTIEGYTIIYPFDIKDFGIYAKVNDIFYKCTLRFRQADICSLDCPILKYYGFLCNIPLDQSHNFYNIKFYISVNGHWIEKKNVCYKKYTPIGNQYKNSYYINDGWKIAPQGSQISIQRINLARHMQCELKFLAELWQTNNTGSRKAVFARILTHIAKIFKKRQIWLISDKANRADDNGEAFFTYLHEAKITSIKPYFLIEKNSPDYKRLKKIGKVIPYMSWYHKFMYLISDYTISAYSHDEINNPFIGCFDPYRDLLQSCKFVFLQHGITKDDVSKGLNKFHKNIKMFVCSTVPEYESVVNTQSYGYSPQDIVLTGLPRYDRLYHAEKNEIVIMPTWRHSLFGSYHPEDSRWDLKPGFKSSEYYNFYNSLLNSPKLLEAAKKLGYIINFVPHPVLFPYTDEFSVPNEVRLWGSEVVYRDMFAQNKLLVTDFSSVAFDFAYLKKPVLYAHFDANHYEEGYFNYEEDGFGEVEYTLNSVIDRMIEYMQNDCQLKTKYLERINNFFAFNDQNNCQRVYEKILELDHQN